MGVLESPRKVLDFFVSKRVGTLFNAKTSRFPLYSNDCRFVSSYRCTNRAQYLVILWHFHVSLISNVYVRNLYAIAVPLNILVDVCVCV